MIISGICYSLCAVTDIVYAIFYGRCIDALIKGNFGLTMQNILSNDVDTIENSYFSQIPSMVFYVASFLFSLCTLLFMNWKMTILLWKII